MAKQIINTGHADKGDGDKLRDAFTKVNANFTELYNTTGADNPADRLVNGAAEVVLDEIGMLTVPGSIVLQDGIITGNDNSDPGMVLGSSNKSVFVSTLSGVDQYKWKFSTDGSTTLPSGGGFARGESGQLKVHDGNTSSLDFRDTGGRGFYTNSDGFSLRSDGDSTWKFGTDNILTLADNTSQIFTTVNGMTLKTPDTRIRLLATDSATSGSAQLYVKSATQAVEITTAANGSSSKTWTFAADGRTIFPNGTVPEHSYGAAGDKEGMVVFSDPYIYYCKQDYVDNTTDIWVRVAWTGTNW